MRNRKMMAKLIAVLLVLTVSIIPTFLTSSAYSAEYEALRKQYGDAYDAAALKFDNALDIINKYSSVIEQYDTLETRMEEAEDCLAEAKEIVRIIDGKLYREKQ